MAEKVVRVLLVDDHVLMRRGLRSLIESMPGWTVCGECDNGRDGVKFAQKENPDIVVMDMSMSDLNGLEATRQIRKSCPQTEVVMLTGQDETDELIHEVFEAGARSFIHKTEAQQELGAALEALAQHKSHFTGRVGDVLFSRLLHQKKGETESPKERLSPREREIVQLVAEGASNKEVADRLSISLKTVETHRAAIMKKLKLDTFSALVRYAIRNHIISA